MCSCATVRHPSTYRQGRPEWTYDLALLRTSDLPPSFEPDHYYLFVGSETIATPTEEAAKAGAMLNALQQVKLFLHSRGTAAFTYQQKNDQRAGCTLRSFSAKSDILKFQTYLDARADSEVVHFEPVRWYLEEHRPLWRMIQPFPNDTRASRWRAWCLVAVPKAICDEIIAAALKQYEQVSESHPVAETSAAVSSESQTPHMDSETKVPVKFTYRQRVAESARIGVVNVVTGPFEIINQPFVCAARQPRENELFQFAGFIQGLPTGVVMGALRVIYGTGSLLVSPFGVPMIPIVSPPEPEFVPPLRVM